MKNENCEAKNMVRKLKNSEVEPAVFGQWQWQCLLCGETGHTTKFQLNMHFEKQQCPQVKEPIKPKSGKHYLYFRENNGERKYYQRIQNSKRKVPVDYDGTWLYERVKRDLTTHKLIQVEV